MKTVKQVKNVINAGVSTASFFPDYTEVSLEKVCQMKASSTEVFLNCYSELEHPYLQALKNMADDHGVQIASVHPFSSNDEPFYFFSQYPRRFQEGVNLYRRYFQAAQILGAKILVFHGDFMQSKSPLELVYERLSQLCQVAQEYDITLCHENVARCISREKDFFVELAKEVPKCGFVFDVKQAFLVQPDIYSFAAAMGNKIRHIHLSDHNQTQHCIPPGTGDLNLPRLLKQVYHQGFDGSVIIELYRDSYQQEIDLQQSYHYLERTIQSMYVSC